MLTDIGQVFGSFDEIRRENLTHSYGIGLRAFFDPFFLGSMEFVWGDEGFRFRVDSAQLFQFTRDMVYTGKDAGLVH